MFNPRDCAIPTIWCGKNSIPRQRYSKKDNVVYIKEGSRFECLQKGFGSGAAVERNKNISRFSLQQIKFVGPVYEENFKKNGIKTTTNLKKYAKTASSTDIEKLLQKVFVKKGKAGLDKKAYNSTLLYLYNSGIRHTPLCEKIK